MTGQFGLEFRPVFADDLVEQCAFRAVLYIDRRCALPKLRGPVRKQFHCSNKYRKYLFVVLVLTMA